MGSFDKAVAEHAVDTIVDMAEAVKQAKAELDELESVIDRQTYDEHAKGDFDLPLDDELHIVLTVADEKRLSKAIRLLETALRGT